MAGRAWLADLTLETVIVHTDAGQSFRGLKAAVYDDCLVLREAMLLEPESQELIGGLVAVPRERVAFIQIVEAT